MGMKWGKGRGRENGKVGRWGDIMEGGGRMGGWAGSEDVGDRGLSGVLGRKEGDVVVV